MKSSKTNRRTILFAAAGAALGTCTGCPSKPATPTADTAKTKPGPLVVLVADDPPLAEAIAREWRGRTEEELTVRPITLVELTGAGRLPGDAVIFPSGYLGQLAERSLIVPLENEPLEDSEFNYRDIFDLVRLREMRWAGRTWAAPLGSPQLLLCYRADVFEKLGLSPPADWLQYEQAVERLSDRQAIGELAPEGDQPWQPAIEPLAEGWAGQLLLARAAAYAMHRDQVSPLFRLGTLEPLIDQPPYVRALEELVAAVKAGGSAQRKSPSEAFTALISGHCAMALTWPTASLRTEPSPARTSKLAFAPLPVSKQAYRLSTGAWEQRGVEDTGPVPLLAASGRMAAVSASSPQATRAGGFVVWLAGREASEGMAPYSSATTLFRHSQVVKSSRWTPQLASDEGRQYAETLQATLTAVRPMPGITLPGRADYLAALDQAVYKALDGKPAAAALAGAAKHWREITDNFGVAAQQKALGHSLGQTSP
jgi:multiple sugar transport system substrate-binding protein